MKFKPIGGDYEFEILEIPQDEMMSIRNEVRLGNQLVGYPVYWSRINGETVFFPEPLNCVIIRDDDGR